MIKIIYCENDCSQRMYYDETDDRGERTIEFYKCANCKEIKTVTTWYDQNGFTLSQDIDTIQNGEINGAL